MLPFTFPNNTNSLWHETTKLPTYPTLEENLEVDITIVGGGITGITLAYLLRQEGYSICLIDANRFLSGTTGNTTAKITVQHGLIYDELINNFDLDTAKLYYEANERALQFMKKTIEENKIDANFTTAPSFLYSTEGDNTEKLEKELAAYEAIGIQETLTTKTELPFQVRQALKIENQAHFHPLHYLTYLLEECNKAGVKLYENTRALSIEYSKRPIVICKDDYRIVSHYVVQTSHYPIFDGEQFFPLKMYADRSYALAAKTKTTVDGMYINIDTPTRSIRPVTIDGDQGMLFAGENHRTGVSDHPMAEHFNQLASFAEKNFTIETIDYQWSDQDYTTADKLPYIGTMTAEKDNVFVATGFRKWGMTNGTNAALLLRNLIINKKCRFADLFSLQRKTKINPNLKNMFTFNAEVAKQLVKGKLDGEEGDISKLEKGKACTIIKEGNRIGVYKDEEDQLYAVDTTCTHLGCELNWNDAEKSWDCPCHGSRFSYEGKVLNGPAVRDLTRYKDL